MFFRAHYFKGLTKHDLFKQTDKSDFYKKHKEAPSTTASARFYTNLYTKYCFIFMQSQF